MSLYVNKVNPDIEQERKKATISSEELAVWWNGGQHQLQEKRKREKFFLEDPDLHDSLPISYMSHKQLYEHSVKKAVHALVKLREYQNKYSEDIDNYKALLGGNLGSGLIKEGNPLSVHFVMFLPTLIGQGTPEQQAEWIPRAWMCNIIGTYAQTELGHGTFIRGLETRADYDPKTEEFMLNSPTLTSYKWWPVAHTANYAIVVAQLYTKNACRGIHSFIVQLRDEETHMPLPGIRIGEIGAKLGMKSINNGFLGMENVRIPRKNMLMKNAQVLKDGTFVKASSSVLTYGTMMFVRVVIVGDASNNLAKAVTIATRYSAVRRQSPIDPNKPEPQIIDHVTQQLKLFPYIAKAFVFKMSANFIWDLYNQVTSEVAKGSLERLPELHAMSCCLKAVCTTDASAGVETLRLACGGHGYMESSNFPTMYGIATAAVTYEGENTVMLLQAARYLLKAWSQALSNFELVPTVAYLGEFRSQTSFIGWDGSILGIIRSFQFVAARKIQLAYESIERRKQSGCSQEEAANLSGIELVQAANLHCRSFLLKICYEQLEQCAGNATQTLATVFRKIIELYAVDTCLNYLGDLLRFVYLNETDVDQLQRRMERVLMELRPNAVAIVDGFDFPDLVLASALGAYDGNVYQRLYEEALKSPLNQEPVNHSFNTYLRPMMKSNL